MNAYLKKKPTLREKRLAVQRWLVGTTFRGLLLSCIIVFGILYLFKVNTVSTQGFVISDLERKIVDLGRENKKLDVEIASQRSMYSIEKRLDKMELVYVDNMIYVTPVGTTVALR